MKAKIVLYRTKDWMQVGFEQGERIGINIPPKLSKEVVRIEDGKIKMGRYVYNTDTDTWEKISKILLFLQSIVEAIKNIFQ